MSAWYENFHTLDQKMGFGLGSGRFYHRKTIEYQGKERLEMFRYSAAGGALTIDENPSSVATLGFRILTKINFSVTIKIILTDGIFFHIYVTCHIIMTGCPWQSYKNYLKIVQSWSLYNLEPANDRSYFHCQVFSGRNCLILYNLLISFVSFSWNCYIACAKD